MASPRPTLASAAEALRSDMSLCLRAIAGDATEGPGVEAHVAAFIDGAGQLQRAFAAAALREAAAADEDSDVMALRAEVVALRAELTTKDALLATHRANVERWRDESMQAARIAFGSE
jgi:hypothetical protein